MREIISHNEIKYIKRRIAPKIREIVEKFPVVVITGARQVGKSTLLKNEFQDFTYLTMDDFALREKARLEPQTLLVVGYITHCVLVRTDHEVPEMSERNTRRLQILQGMLGKD